MERQEFETLIGRMEVLAAQHPVAYQRRVFAVAALGYLYLGVVVVVLAAIFIALLAAVATLKWLALKLLVIVGAPLWLIVRSLWVRLPRPTGEALTRASAPELFQQLDDLRQRLGAPRVQVVLVTPDFNAGITQIPRLGLFGWYRNYLLLGLPLMKSLTVEQFRAVLAHELGHLSGGHARFGNRIYRMRLIWGRLETTIERSSQLGSFVIRRFLKWYVPYFNALSFPLARANEFEADAASAALTSVRAAAQALTNTCLTEHYLAQKYWPHIHAGAKDLPEPVLAPYAGFVASSLAETAEGELRAWRDTALATKTSYADTHPALADRLKALGAQAEFVPPLAGASAAQLLGVQLGTLETKFDQEWRTRVADSWRRFHDQTQKNRSRLEELRRQASNRELTESEALEFADLEEAVGLGDAAALALRRAVVQRHPESTEARFAVARQLLQSDAAEGASEMEALVAAEARAVAAGAELLRDYFHRRGDGERAQAWHERLIQHSRATEEQRRERSRLLATDVLVRHQLDDAALARLVAQLSGIRNLRSAYLVRKLTQHAPESPVYFLGYRTGAWWRIRSAAEVNSVIKSLQARVQLPGLELLINLDSASAATRRAFRRARDSRLRF